MKHEAQLDCVVFQLSDARTRCELWIAAAEASEKLASGSLAPFVSHLEAAQEQLDRGASFIKLQAPRCPWFTKGTIERFVRFVSTPDVLERVSALETERLKLAEASTILVSGEASAQVGDGLVAPSAPPPAANPGSSAHRVDKLDIVQKFQADGPVLDSSDMEAETSKKHLINAMDARRLILEKEQRKAFVRAAAAGFHMESLSDLIAFSDRFGATQLREACLKFSAMHKRLKGFEVLDSVSTSALGRVDIQSSGMWLSSASEVKSQQQADRVDDGPHEVRIYGRRRVWGPPVVDISPQRSSSIPDSDKKGPLRQGDECSDQCGSPSTGHSESDWEETDDNSKRPLYANVIAELETKNDLPPVAAKVEPEGRSSLSQGQQSAAVRRKGIVVIRNVNSSQTEAPAKMSESDTESDKDEARATISKRPGRLSVQDAIHLFESKQKQTAKTRGHEANGKETLAKACSPNDVSLAALSSPKTSGARNVVADEVPNQVVEDRLPTNPAGSFNFNEIQSAQTSVNGSGLGSSKQQRSTLQDLNVAHSDPVAEADRVVINKDLLDRSYSCLLKINSVVQDALKHVQQVEPVITAEQEWRSLSSTYPLDDMFIDSKVPSAATTRRQSLCTPSEYTNMATEAPTIAKANASPDHHEKGRLYEQYQEIREAKKRERILQKTEQEAKLNAMQDVLERRKTELLVAKSTRLPAKLNTMSAEQLHAAKAQATRNSNVLRTKREGRSDNYTRTNSENIVTQKTRNVQRNQKQEQVSARTAATGKTSPGPKAAASKSSSRLLSSPQSKNLSGAPTNTTNQQRRSPSFMSQSVIAENMPLRKENAKPLLGRNCMINNQNSRYSQRDQTVRPLESNRGASYSRLPAVPADDKSRKTGRKLTPPGSDSRENLSPATSRQPKPAPAASRYQVSGRIRPVAVEMEQAVELKKAPSKASIPESRSSREDVVKSNEECIKQIVSCVNNRYKQESQEQDTAQVHDKEHQPDTVEELGKMESCRLEHPLQGLVRSTSDVRYDASSSHCRVGSLSLEAFKVESFKEQVEDESTFQLSEELYASDCSKHFDDEDMQIDEGPDKCTSGRSLTAVPEASPTVDRLHQLEQRLQPPVKIHDETLQERAAAAAAKDDQPRGLKRLLKFGRKNTSNTSKVRDNTSSRSLTGSSVRRSLEALPDISARSFFSSFRK